METINEFLIKQPFWSLVFSVVAGAFVTWLAARWYYQKAGEELRDESKKLRDATDLVIYCLINKNAQVSAKYNETGHISGLFVTVSGAAVGASQATADSS